VLAGSHGPVTTQWPLLLLTIAITVLVWRTRIHLLWLLAVGAVLGGLGWI